MESKYNIENFERFLKEKTDEFKMYPSKRVWYSIYNDMHPGNRLPSISMCIILICSLFLVGYLNTGNNTNLAASAIHAKTYGTFSSNELGQQVKNSDLSNQQPAALYIGAASQKSSASKTNALNSTNTINKKITGTQNTVVDNEKNNKQVAFASATLVSIAEEPLDNSVVNKEMNPGINALASTVTGSFFNDKQTTLTSSSNTDYLFASDKKYDTKTAVNNIKLIEDKNNIAFPLPTTQEQKANTEEIQVATNGTPDNKLVENVKEQAVAVPVLTVAEINKENPNKEIDSKTPNNKITAASDKAWIENFAMYNRPAAKKWAGKVSWQAYVTPSVVYRKLHNNTADKQLSGNGNGNFNNSNVDIAVTQKPSFGLETGLSLQYDFLKILKLKAGVQLNYTRYNAHAYENHHPIASSITLNSEGDIPYEVFRTTPYSNNIGLNPVNLHNETYQLSLPIGADLRLFSNDIISWYAGATIQPTFVVYANSYLVSSDRRNYIKDRSMLNRFNLNAGFETYLSFKTSGYTWQLGPQFRSQIFSTNNKIYSVEERLMNYGFKIGVSKKL